jgi:hypothetical protein
MDIESRLALLESVLGLHESDSLCKYDPETCGEHCTPETCPYTTNRVTLLTQQVDSLTTEVLFLRSALEEVLKSGVLSDTVAQKAKVRANLIRTERKLADVQRLKMQAQAVPNLLKNVVAREQELIQSVEGLRNRLLRFEQEE